jgi:tRNA1Val (adenine37-N6)-methyltransferase
MFCGIEIQPESAEIAKRNVDMNGLSDKITIIEGDIKDAENFFPLSSFDVICTNPPYKKAGSGLLNDFTPKAIARHEILINLQEIISKSEKLLKPQGRFYMVHRPERLTDIIKTLSEHNMEAKKLRFIHSTTDKEAILVLIEAVRGGRQGAVILPPVVM